MSEPAFLDAYAGQSVDELLGLEATHRVDSIILAFHQALSYKAWRSGDSALAAAERIVLVIEALESEVNNGGYHLFFTNSTREYAPEIEAALLAIDCPRNAELAKRALSALDIGTSLDSASIERALEKGGDALAGSLHAIDQEYFALGEDIAGRLLAFLKAHKGSIVLDKQVRAYFRELAGR